MITIYKNKPNSKEKGFIRINDPFFNKTTVNKLDERAERIIRKIDQSKMLDKYAIESRFDSTRLNMDKLSTGCKTVLNILYNPDVIFDISECGDNALEVIYSLDQGKVYCDYPMIAFDFKEARVVDGKGIRIVKDYEELKEWWKNEN